ncbi:MAG: MarR family transcriptional regulator, partial [Christensenella sp.]|uniref:MarR family winged helix-turn-helix transcriptional regulator n=1 Tax=Christensenella sp. TaxID=1935934 RepID=UPI002B212AA3
MRNQQVEDIGRQISILYRQTQKFINKRMQPYGLNYSDHAFLIHISQNPGINQRQLARILTIDEAVVTRVLKKLEDNGFVTREKDAEDMR